MYKILIGLFLSVLCLQAKCQIQFDEGSFTEVLTKAKQEKRWCLWIATRVGAALVK